MEDIEPASHPDSQIVPTGVPGTLVVAKSAQDVEEDYDFSREQYKLLVRNSNSAIEAMLNLALQCESPKAFETLNAMLTSTAELTGKLMALQMQKKTLETFGGQQGPGGQPPQIPPGSSLNQTNNFFTGTTADLQRKLISDLAASNAKIAEKTGPEVTVTEV